MLHDSFLVSIIPRPKQSQQQSRHCLRRCQILSLLALPQLHPHRATENTDGQIREVLLVEAPVRGRNGQSTRIAGRNDLEDTDTNALPLI